MSDTSCRIIRPRRSRTRESGRSCMHSLKSEFTVDRGRRTGLQREYSVMRMEMRYSMRVKSSAFFTTRRIATNHAKR